MEENRIVKNSEALTTFFIPSRLAHRDGQLKAIRDSLNPVTKNLQPRNVFLFGKPGTGKTCMARYVLEELQENSGTERCYINCWEAPGRFKILYTILEKLGQTLSIHRKGMPTDTLLELLKKKVQYGYLVVVLDEVDQLEDDKVIYDLLTIPQTALILISNFSTSLFKLDPRIRSRLASADNIEFPAYTTSEITDILADRASWALVPGVITKSQLERIAQASAGDARVAIDLLRIVSDSAENQDMEKITDTLITSSIKSTLPKAQGAKREEKTKTLNQYQKAILELLKPGQMDSGTLYQKLSETIKKQNLEPIVDRTFRKYIDRLIQARLVSASGTGRWRTYSIENG